MLIAYNEEQIDLHAFIKVKTNVREGGQLVKKLIETTVGRVLFNQFVPHEVGYINALATKKSLREIIGDIIKITTFQKRRSSLMILKHLVSVWHSVVVYHLM